MMLPLFDTPNLNLSILLAELAAKLDDTQLCERVIDVATTVETGTLLDGLPLYNQALLTLWRTVATCDRQHESRLDIIDALLQANRLPATSMVVQQFRAIYEENGRKEARIAALERHNQQLEARLEAVEQRDRPSAGTAADA